MLLIREIVQQTLVSGYLPIGTELQLCQLFSVSQDLEDVDSMAQLQQAVTSGQVKRQLSMKAPASVSVKQLV
jgi:hypothetical protein